MSPASPNYSVEQNSALRLYISGFIILFFVILFCVPAGKPFHLDDAEFPVVAEQTAATGLPFYYHGETSPRASALFHPPLYIYLLAVWMKVFGTGEAPVRLFGMVCALLQGAVVLAIVRTLFGAALMSRAAPWFWAIYLLNPYTLQTASISDIDSTIYGPLLCSVLLTALWVTWRDGERRSEPAGLREYSLVSVALALCFWAKLTTVLLVLPWLFFLWIGTLGVRRAAVAAAGVAAAGAALFLLTYMLFGALTGMDILYTARFTYFSFANRGSSGGSGISALLADYVRNLRYMGPFMLSWTGALPWVAACGCVVIAARRLIVDKDRRWADYAIVLSLALATTFYHIAKVATFGAAPYKYVFVYWGLILSATCILLLQSEVLRFRWIALALYGGGALWAATRMGDVMMLNGFVGPWSWIVVLPGLVLAAGLMPWRLAPGLVVLSICLHFGMQLGIAGYQAKAPHATTYDYGQTGFTDTVAYVRANTGPDDIIVSMKDIGYAARRRYHENYGALYGGQAEVDGLMTVLSSGKAAYAIFTEGRGQDQLIIKPALRDWVLAHCKLVQSYGNYRIYRYQGDAVVQGQLSSTLPQGAK